MKKTLLSLAFLGAIFTGNAQQIVFEDFNSFTLGNIGTDYTGNTLGQYSWGTQTAAGSNADFQVVNFDVAHGKSIKIVGSADANNTKYLFQDLSADWGTRDAGKNIVEMEYEFYSGGASSSKNSHRFIIRNAGLTKDLVGLVFYPETKIIRGRINFGLGSAANTNYTILLGGSTLGSGDITLAADTWYKVGVSYNQTTGAVRFKGGNGLFDVTITNGITYDGSVVTLSPSETPDEYDFVNFSGTGNASSSNAIFDNMNLRFTSTDNLLSVGNEVISSKFSISPNPANHVVNITNADNMLVNGVTIADLNGRTVKNVSFEGVANAQVNVADLASGLYIMNVTSDKGTATKKFVKN